MIRSRLKGLALLLAAVAICPFAIASNLALQLIYEVIKWFLLLIVFIIFVCMGEELDKQDFERLKEIIND